MSIKLGMTKVIDVHCNMKPTSTRAIVWKISKGRYVKFKIKSLIQCLGIQNMYEIPRVVLNEKIVFDDQNDESDSC